MFRLSFAVVGVVVVSPVILREHRPVEPVAPAIVLDEVTVVDVEQGRLVPRQRVVVVGNRIQAVGSAGQVAVPAGALRIAAQGKYLIPGLWDMHTHATRWAQDVYYPLFIANGVTGIRDAWSQVPLDTLHLWRQEILAGTRVGPPRQVLSGVGIDEQDNCERKDLSGGHACVTSGDTADMRVLVAQLRTAGVDMLKTYGLSDTGYLALAAEARRQGIPFGGHVELLPLVASEHGASIVDHEVGTRDCEHLLPAGTGGESVGLSATDGFRSKKRAPGDSSLGPDFITCLQNLATQFRKNGTWFVPTRLLLWNFHRHGGNDASIPAAVERFDRFAKARMADFWLGTLPSGNWLHSSADAAGRAAGTGTSAKGGADSLDGFVLAQRVGIPLLAGTDVVPTYLGVLPPGLSLHAEVAAYVQEGLTPLEALRTATLNPARLLHATDSLGSVGPGKLADLVLLDADPLADITNTTAIHAVIANGRYFDRAALDSLASAARIKGGALPPAALGDAKRVVLFPAAGAFAMPELHDHPRYGAFWDHEYYQKHATASERTWVDSTIAAVLAKQRPGIQWVGPAALHEFAAAGKIKDPATYGDALGEESSNLPEASLSDSTRTELTRLVAAADATPMLIPVAVRIRRGVGPVTTDSVCTDLMLQVLDGRAGTLRWRNFFLLGAGFEMGYPPSTGCGATPAAALASALAVAFPK